METVVIYVIYGAEFTATNMESKMKTLKHIIKGQFESIEELITLSLDHWTALYSELGRERTIPHITADIKRRNHLGESYAYEFVNIVLRRIVLQNELEEVLVQKENFFDIDPEDPDYDSDDRDYNNYNLKRLDDRESEIVDELEELEGADQPESVIRLKKVIVEDPAITEHETKCQADDENRHLGDGSIFSG